MSTPHVVVVGHGMVGARLVEELLRRPTPPRITVVGGEPYPAYNRVLLSDVVAGRADVSSLALLDETSLAEHGVEVLLGDPAVALDRDAHVLRTASGRDLPYDALVLATGSTAVVPPLAGIDRHSPLPRRAYVFRSVDDCRAIIAASTTSRRAVVLGGGLLGIEAARGLARRGLPTTLVHRGPVLMERQLDPTGSRVLAGALGRLDVEVSTAVGARGLVLDDEQRFAGLLLDDGTLAAGDLLVVACGVQPETTVAEAAGLTCSGGVVTDEALRSIDDPDVFAIGDCAAVPGATQGLVAPGWEQARLLAERLGGGSAVTTYRPSPVVTRLKAADLDVAAMGETHLDVLDTDAERQVLALADPSAGRYVKVVVRDGRLAGAVVVGSPRAAADLTLLFDRQTPVPADRTALLLPADQRASADSATDDPTRIPERATVCRCNGVTKGALVRAWSEGARSTDEMASRTRAGTGCGSCRSVVDGIAAWLRQVDPDEPDAAGTADSRRPPTSPASRTARPAPSPEAAPAGGSR